MQLRSLPLAIVASLAIAGSGSVAFAATDAEITGARQESQISTTYALSPYLRNHDLQVVVANGTATLTGNVDEEATRELAGEIALGVKGVTDVDNQIEVLADYTAPDRSNERSFGDVIDDASITSAIKNKLLWSKYASGLKTDVDTTWGHVELKGSADTEAAKSTAESLALNTHGVRSVDNQLVVQATGLSSDENAAQGSNTGMNAGMHNNMNDGTHSGMNDGMHDGMEQTVMQEVSDAWITTKVKSTFLYSSNVDGLDINVSTVDGKVSLAGKVDSGAEQALAVEIAGNVRGVKSVNSEALAYVD